LAAMKARRGRSRVSRPSRRVLLVGFSPLLQAGLEVKLSKVAEVVSVSFPSADFDQAVEQFEPDVVLVDVTYLDEQAVRPLISRRLRDSRSLVVYVSDRGGRLDDLGSGTTRELEDTSIASLVALASGSPLTLVVDL